MFFTVKVVTKILVDALWGVSYPPLPLLPRYTHANPPSLSFLLSSLYCNLWLYFISLLSIIPRDWWAGTTHSVKNFLDFIPRYPSPTPPSWQITYFYSTKHLRNFHFLMALMNCLASNLPSAESQLLYAPPPPPPLKNNTWQTVKSWSWSWLGFDCAAMKVCDLKVKLWRGKSEKNQNISWIATFRSESQAWLFEWWTMAYPCTVAVGICGDKNVR